MQSTSCHDVISLNMALALLIALLFYGYWTAFAVIVILALMGIVSGLSWASISTLLTGQTPLGQTTTMSLSGVLAGG